ncbi:MAG TPA: hypothetical protein VF316_13130 [Polyangiaceae bacterium]
MAVFRRDPRAEEDSEGEGFAVDRVGAVPVPKRPPSEPAKVAPKTASLPPPAQESPASTPRFDSRANPKSERPVEAPLPEPAPPAPPAAAAPAKREPRLLPLDRMINDNDWRAVSYELGPLADAGKLPPSLALLAAIAHRETSEQEGQEAIAVGVRAMAKLLGVPDDGAIAGVVARRLLRTNPVRFRDRKAPPPRVSILIAIMTLVVGGTVGWLLSGGWSVVRHWLR